MKAIRSHYRSQAQDSLLQQHTTNMAAFVFSNSIHNRYFPFFELNIYKPKTHINITHSTNIIMHLNVISYKISHLFALIILNKPSSHMLCIWLRLVEIVIAQSVARCTPLAPSLISFYINHYRFDCAENILYILKNIMDVRYIGYSNNMQCECTL